MGLTASIGAALQGLLGGFGIKGQLAILFIIFFVDSVLFPMLPEAFVVYFYNVLPPFDTRFSDRTDLFLTAAVILLVVLAAELAANGLLFALMKWKMHRLPKRMTRAMNKWREFLLVKDERVVLLNRVVPVMPFTGAFIAVSPWQPRRAFGFLVLGGALKYGFLLLVVALAGLIFDPNQTWLLSFGLIGAVLVLSLASQLLLRKKVKVARAGAVPPDTFTEKPEVAMEFEAPR
jgi:hypothetical protein